MMEALDMTIENLKEQLIEIKQHISECRKKGKDTKIAELRVIPIPAKIKLLEVTREIKDVQKVISLLNLAKNEVDDIKKQGLNSEEPIEENLQGIRKLVDLMNKSIDSSNFSAARQNYQKARDMFPNLSREEKKEVYKSLCDISKRLS